ncbi:MAG: hypothetical protein H6605_04330 [Flavobacteriales bacterium]|nr:hypothetical protein [Flavobacteriales bacterium]
MKTSEFKKNLQKLSALNFMQPNGSFVPRHFHITEAGIRSKHFVDCGGTLRSEKLMGLQIWVAKDFEHRLEPAKLLKILDIAESNFGNEDLEIEIEYQTETIGRYAIELKGENFVLIPKQTDCLAADHCGIPQEKQKLKLSELGNSTSCCTPGSGCC